MDSQTSSVEFKKSNFRETNLQALMRGFVGGILLMRN